MQAILPSRRRVILLTLAVLMVLDLARSVEAHLGYAQATLMWQPDPKVYADIAWPPGSDLPANATNGQRVYAQHCQVCHGPDGRGNGPAAPSLIPRPRDFTIGQFKYKTTPPDQPPSDADLIDIITNGLQASAMPFWKNTLSAADIRDVVAFIKTFSPVKTFIRVEMLSRRVPKAGENSDVLPSLSVAVALNLVALAGAARLRLTVNSHRCRSTC